MRRRYCFLLPVFLFCLLPAALRAQAKIALYGTIGTEKSEVNNSGWSAAGTFGIYYGLANLGPVAISADLRGDLSTNINSGLIGPRVALHFPLFPLKPYVELLAGVSAYNTSNNGAKSSTDLNYRWVGGLDTAVLPHLDWRVADYSYSGGGISQGNVTRHPQTLSTGIVVRF